MSCLPSCLSLKSQYRHLFSSGMSRAQPRAPEGAREGAADFISHPAAAAPSDRYVEGWRELHGLVLHAGGAWPRLRPALHWAEVPFPDWWAEPG